MGIGINNTQRLVPGLIERPGGKIVDLPKDETVKQANFTVLQGASMPAVLRGITFLIPARYYVTVTRGIFLKGVGYEVLWPQATMMLLYAVIGLTLATRAFKKELVA